MQQHEPISDGDILKLIRTRVLRYGDLAKFNDIDSVLINDSVVILIPHPDTPNGVGHWVCVYRHGDILSYFDSYGRLPDNEMYLNGDFPYLSQLLLVSPYVLEYNDHNYQKHNMATCGRHVIVRILMKDRSIDDYDRFMRAFKDDDALVTAITSMIKK